MTNDTIVAIATPPGESAVALIRLSGPAACEIAARRFEGRRSPGDSASHRILFGNFRGLDGSALDSVLLFVFRAPRSYTGEDVVEISSHGGFAIPSAILESLVAGGARAARPGEFTERAFQNGKIDLAQAESVAALVRARSERAARAARSTLAGELSRRIAALDRELVSLLAEAEARIDFPNDVEDADRAGLAERCARVAGPIRDWIDRLPSARLRERGVRVALLGRPNVGKSTLLNALVGYERAIVSEIPGTTRDTVEESVWIDGVEIRLCDSAGVRTSGDAVERLGLDRTRRAAEAADLAIVVLDRSDPWAPEDRDVLALVEGRPHLRVWNKADLAGAETTPPPAPAGYPSPLAEVSTVAVRPGGADSLRAALRAAFPRVLGSVGGEEIPSTSARQEALLRGALDALDRAASQLKARAPSLALAPAPASASMPAPEETSYDLVAVDLTEARKLLGEIVGRGVDQDVIAAIFSQFCIGK